MGKIMWRRLKLSWRFPQRSQSLIFDIPDSLLPVFEGASYSTFANRTHDLNVWALLGMLVRLRFSWRDYCVTYIRMTGCSLVITVIDSNATFYSFKSSLPHIRFIAIQNGIRGTGTPRRNGDLWTMLRASRYQPPQVDLLVPFGPAHGAMYARQIQCETLAIGSLRNNSVPIRQSRARDTVTRIGFISNFNGQPHIGIFADGTANPIVMYLGDREVSAREYFAADAFVASALAILCEESGWMLHIIGRRPSDVVHERRFFAEACGSKAFTFSPKDSFDGSYRQLDECNLVVAVDSTLGYEMIARGSRVVFVAARAPIIGGAESRQFSFGYPESFPDEGPFWTSSLDLTHLHQLLSSVLEMPDEEWMASSKFMRDKLMAFDPGNVLLRRAITSFLGGL